jgi:hypothetical protein
MNILLILMMLPSWVLWLGGALVIVFGIRGDWLRMFGRLDPYKQELAKASHGAALVILAPCFYHYLKIDGWLAEMPPEYRGYAFPAMLALVAFGGYLFFFGAARTKAERKDAQLMTRAGIKLIIGLALLGSIFKNVFPPRSWELDWTERHYAVWIGLFVGGWCLITSVVKIGLLMRAAPPVSGDDTEAEPYGSGTYGSGGGLSGQTSPSNGALAKWKSSWGAGWHLK